MVSAIRVDRVSHTYGNGSKKRTALRAISVEIESGKRFALLGPNGGGKTTLFRLLSTLLPPQEGAIEIFGEDAARRAASIRKRIGVVFQEPGIDKMLSCFENLRHQGWLYGLSGSRLGDAIARALDEVGLTDRSSERAASLSGGLQRRLEIAKALLHEPRLLILDEPSTGLDPGIRRDLWETLDALRKSAGLTVIFTTHLMDEAENADAVAILDEGRIVAQGDPGELRNRIGGDVLQIRGEDLEGLAKEIESRFRQTGRIVGDGLFLERENAHAFLPELVEAFPGRVLEARFSKPSLEDVFIHETGRRFASSEDAP